MESLQLPALIVAIPAGVAVAARGALWVRQVMTPLHPTANSTGEWRGEIRTLIKQQGTILGSLAEGQHNTEKILETLARDQGDIHELLVRQTEVLERLGERET